MASWHPYALAALAPAVVWLLWRGQTLSVELLRWRLVKLTRNKSQMWLYATVSWFGVFVHELAHASVLVLSGHGIRGFKVGMEQGHVTPGKGGKGAVSFLFFLVAALAPLFLPPILFLAALLLLVKGTVDPWPDSASSMSDATWAGARDVLDGILAFPKDLAWQLAHLDLGTWQGAALLVVALLAMPASRPSHVKGSRFHGTQDEGDVAVLRRRIRQNPLPFLLFLAVLYAAYLACVAFGPAWAAKGYWYAFAALWAVALCGVVLALLGAVWWSLCALDGKVRWGLAWLPFAAFVAVQVAGRTAGRDIPLPWLNLGALAAWALVALAMAMVLPRRARIP